MSVLITGATGFIALHIIDQLLAKGYTVIGTVRSSTKGNKLVEQFKNNKFSYVIVSDLCNVEEFNTVFQNNKDIEIVIHSAAGVSITDKIQELIVDPAIKGTKNILTAIAEYGPQVKNLVYTSSTGAMITLGTDGPGIYRDETVWNENSWEISKNHPLLAYCYAKGQAERAVWEWAKEHREIKVACVNPSFVFGPQVFQEDVKQVLNSSNEMITTVLKHGEKYVKSEGHWVDVRDVAKAHLAAFEKDNTRDKRLVMIEGVFTEQSVLDIVHRNFPTLEGVSKGIPERECSLVWEKKNIINTDKTKEILGWKYITLDKCVKDIVQQAIDGKVYQ